MCCAVAPKNFVITSAVRLRPRPVVSISMPNVCVLRVYLLSVGGVYRPWCTHTSLCCARIATRPIHQITGAEIALMRQRKGMIYGSFLYARAYLPLVGVWLIRLLHPGRGPNNPTRPANSDCCFSARCRSNKPRCVRKKGCYALQRPPTPPVRPPKRPAVPDFSLLSAQRTSDETLT